MATKQLKWENNALKKQAEEITKELSTLREGIKIANNELTHSKSWRSSEETFQADSRDLQFYTDSYDALCKFYKDASNKLLMIEKKLLTIKDK